MDATDTVRICKKCLLTDVPESEQAASIARFVEGIDSNNRTPQTQYRERLAFCRTCEKLLSGTCLVCGCFVEIRAAQLTMHCPGEQKCW